MKISLVFPQHLLLLQSDFSDQPSNSVIKQAYSSILGRHKSTASPQESRYSFKVSTRSFFTFESFQLDLSSALLLRYSGKPSFYHSIMPSITNVNDLPEEVHKAFFDNFDPIERTLILSTCKMWYDLIMETRAWWREVKVVEGDSKEKMMRILQVFDQRSQGSLIKVRINRRIETKEELQEILSAIEPSVGSIKFLTLRQNSHLNTQTITFARRLPQLRDLHALSTPMVTDAFVSGTGLRHLGIGSLDGLEQEDVEWLSQLESLSIINLRSERTLWSILRSCKASLVLLLLGDLGISEGQGFRSEEPIFMEALVDFHVVRAGIVSSSTLPFIAPALKTLQCTPSQAGVTESPSLKSLTLTFEDEEVDDWEEDQEQVDGFVERIRNVFQQTPKLKILALEGRWSANFQPQSQRILQALLISDENEKEVLLPNLLRLRIQNFEEDALDLRLLAKVAISRAKYVMSQVFLEVGGSKINMDALDEESRKLVSSFFKVGLDPLDPSLKDDLMEQYLEVKASIYKV